MKLRNLDYFSLDLNLRTWLYHGVSIIVRTAWEQRVVTGYGSSQPCLQGLLWPSILFLIYISCISCFKNKDLSSSFFFSPNFLYSFFPSFFLKPYLVFSLLGSPSTIKHCILEMLPNHFIMIFIIPFIFVCTAPYAHWTLQSIFLYFTYDTLAYQSPMLYV